MENNSYEDCKYCCDDVSMRDYVMFDGSNGIYIDGNGNLIGDIYFELEGEELKFCPMCGRKF